MCDANVGYRMTCYETPVIHCKTGERGNHDVRKVQSVTGTEQKVQSTRVRFYGPNDDLEKQAK